MTKQLLTVQEVAELLSLTPHTVRLMAKENRITYLRIGGQYRFPADQLDEWIASRTYPAVK